MLLGVPKKSKWLPLEEDNEPGVMTLPLVEDRANCEEFLLNEVTSGSKEIGLEKLLLKEDGGESEAFESGDPIGLIEGEGPEVDPVRRDSS